MRLREIGIREVRRTYSLGYLYCIIALVDLIVELIDGSLYILLLWLEDLKEIHATMYIVDVYAINTIMIHLSFKWIRIIWCSDDACLTIQTFAGAARIRRSRMQWRKKVEMSCGQNVIRYKHSIGWFMKPKHYWFG